MNCIFFQKTGDGISTFESKDNLNLSLNEKLNTF